MLHIRNNKLGNGNRYKVRSAVFIAHRHVPDGQHIILELIIDFYAIIAYLQKPQVI
jgi:hypothetical protein